jgi:gamma-glutamylcyclotransferase (GGCT)/AIG2-like uncharacterized protein YtfP
MPLRQRQKIQALSWTASGKLSRSMALVFQYGSNCLDSQINGEDRLRGDAKFIGIAETVDGYRIAFTVLSKTRNCAAADMEPSPGDKVWGVLYEVPELLIDRKTADLNGRKSLDAIEGEGKNYTRCSVVVRSATGDIHTAITYRVSNPQPNLRTSLEYVGYIVRGLRERGVSEQYVANVKTIASANNPDIAPEIGRL